MTTRRPARRPGLTLTEALVALFVAALGMISLLVLFPLGAVQMGQALKDERTAQTARRADGLLREYWQSQVVEPVGPRGASAVAGVMPAGPCPHTLAFTDPNDNWFRYDHLAGTAAVPSAPPVPVAGPMGPTLGQVPLFPNAIPGPFVRRPQGAGPASATRLLYRVLNDPAFNDGTAPSYPVYLDPIGWQTRNAAPQSHFWTAGTADDSWLYLPRRTVRGLSLTVTPGTTVLPRLYQGVTSPAGTPVYSPTATFVPSLQFATLQDDLTYEESGHAIGPNGVVERAGRYSWSAILQRPVNGIPTTANLTVMVFEGRAPGYLDPNAERMYPRDAGPGNAPPANTPANRQAILMAVGGTAITLHYDPAVGPPAISKGRWILDGTIFNPLTPTAYLPAFLPAVTEPIRNATFYRVVSTTDDGNGTFTVELQTPILKPLGTNNVLSYPGQIYVFQGLSEVFVRPPLQPLSAPR